MGYYKKQATSKAKHISKAATISESLDILGTLSNGRLRGRECLFGEVTVHLAQADNGVSKNKGREHDSQ